MRIPKNPKYFICEGWTDILYPLEVQQDLRKSVYSSQYAFRLRARYQLLARIFS